MLNNKTIRLITAIAAIIVALGGTGMGGYYYKDYNIEGIQENQKEFKEDTKELEQIVKGLIEYNRIQDSSLAKHIHMILDMQGDFDGVRKDVKDMKELLEKMNTNYHVMNAMLKILVEGYDGG